VKERKGKYVEWNGELVRQEKRIDSGQQGAESELVKRSENKQTSAEGRMAAEKKAGKKRKEEM
jgi:hypothetical protein